MTARASAATDLRTWARMVKLSHSVFALPFAFSGMALAAARHGIEVRQVVLVVVAMVAARSAAMGFNRLADQTIDAANPRTADRELPSGRLTRGVVWAFTLALSAVFVAASFGLNPLCGRLSPLALVIVFGYSYTKRYTWASHLVLGLALAIAPVGGYIAVAGSVALLPWLLAAAVLFWVAGFDVVYACQDVAFDRSAGLHSIPARFGPARALAIARGFHAASLAAMVAVGLHAGLHPAYFAGLLAIAFLLVWEHRLVSAADLSRVGVAFLNANATVSVLYLVTLLVALALRRF